MAHRIEREIDTLVHRGVIDDATAERLRAYYNPGDGSAHAAQVAFGGIGAVLLVIGVALLSVYAWDHVENTGRTVISVIPAISGVAALVLTRRGRAWGRVARETGVTVAFIGLGATVMLLLELYHAAPEVRLVFGIWLAVTTPLLVLSHSSTAAVLYAAVTVLYGFAGIWLPVSVRTWIGVLFLVPVLVHAWRVFSAHPASNMLAWQSWIVPLVPIMLIFALTDDFSALLLPGAVVMAACFLIAGRTSPLVPYPVGRSATLVGYVMVTVSLVLGNLREFWQDYRTMTRPFAGPGDLLAPEILFLLVFLVVAALLVASALRRGDTPGRVLLDPATTATVAFVPVGLIGLWTPSVAFALSILILTLLGTWEVYRGARSQRMGQLNVGLCIIAGTVVLRVFDYDLSLMVRGTAFLLVGAAATVVNVWVLAGRSRLSP